MQSRLIQTMIRALGVALLAAMNPAAAAEREVIQGPVDFGQVVYPAYIKVDMTTLAEPQPHRPGDPIKEVPQRKNVPRDFNPPTPDPRPVDEDPLRAYSHRGSKLSGGPAFDQPLISVQGQGFSSVNPPDTVGDVGLFHFVQMINGSGGTRVRVLDKETGDTVVTFNLPSLAVGSGTTCASGIGDPIILFDSTVDNGIGEPTGRWLMTEFTNTSFCVYVSETADFMDGGWFVYQFTSASGGLPDYPKWAVWPDAYYVGANEGRRLYAFDRENMLQGNPVRPFQVFQVPGLAGFGFQMLQPADWDGMNPPPAGSPAWFLRHRDDEAHNPGSSDPTRDFVEIWSFSVDWDTPASSQVAGPLNIEIAEFSSDLCGFFAFACVPQPNSGTTLDPLREPVMWRAQYRNFGSHEVIVGSFVTDVTGSNLHGVRWFELRKAGVGDWVLEQEGLVSPDDVNRWMSSIAMDEAGNMAMVYNVSDATSTFPGIRYIGRLAGDPPGTMPRGEVSLVDGSAPNTSNRYGDYASITVDPVDGCTFWMTSQYNPASQWSTWIAATRFQECGEPGFALAAAPAVGGVCTAGGAADFVSQISVISVSEFFNPVTLTLDMAPAGFNAGFAPNPVVPGNGSTLTIDVSPAVVPGDYPLSVLGMAMDADDRSTALQVTVATSLAAAPDLIAPANGAFNVAFQPELTWSAVDQAQSYRIEVSTDAQFNTIVYNPPVSGPSHIVATPLDSSTVHYWRVRADNPCGDGAWSAVRNFSTQPLPGDCPIDLTALNVYSDDMESGAPGWTLGEGSTENNSWQLTDQFSFSGDFAWFAQDLAEISDQRLVSPEIQLPGVSVLPLTLRFYNRQQIETAAGAACWDGAILEISTDGGDSWTQLQDQILIRPYDGIVNNFAAGPNPLAGLPAWCGDPRDWEDYAVDLSAFAGEAVRLRFRLGTDSTVGRPEGWILDDVRVEACAGEEIFADSFEST